MVNTGIGLLSGMVGTAVNSSTNSPTWVSIVIAVVPPVIGILWDLLKSYGTKKGWFNKSTTNKIDTFVDNIVEDIKDDGKLNNSNKDKE